MILESQYSYDLFLSPDIISRGVNNQKIELLKKCDMPPGEKFIIEFKEATYNDVMTYSIIKRVMLDIQQVQSDFSPFIFDCDYGSFNDIIKDDTVEIDWI